MEGTKLKVLDTMYGATERYGDQTENTGEGLLGLEILQLLG